MRGFRYIFVLAGIMGALFAASCDVHEFPYPVDKEVPFVLHLDYSTDLPQHKVVEYYEDENDGGTKAGVSDIAANTRSAGGEELYDVRYIVVVDTIGNNISGNHKYRFVFTEDEVSSLDNSIELEIMEGRYNFTVWTDYVLAGAEADNHYKTAKFGEISFNSQEHLGSNDWKDAFNGSVESVVSESVTQAVVPMARPLAKFNFISTDVEKFVSKVENAGGGTSGGNTGESINWDDYKIVFNYKGFVPYSFNLYTDKPADARTNVSFESKINFQGGSEAELGFDYVFVHKDETFVTVSVAIYDKDGELVSQSRPVDVPLLRSKLTTVKAAFLTSEAGGGVTIVPDFDGEHNLEIK